MFYEHDILVADQKVSAWVTRVRNGPGSDVAVVIMNGGLGGSESSSCDIGSDRWRSGFYRPSEVIVTATLVTAVYMERWCVWRWSRAWCRCVHASQRGFPSGPSGSGRIWMPLRVSNARTFDLYSVSASLLVNGCRRNGRV